MGCCNMRVRFGVTYNVWLKRVKSCQSWLCFSLIQTRIWSISGALVPSKEKEHYSSCLFMVSFSSFVRQRVVTLSTERMSYKFISASRFPCSNTCTHLYRTFPIRFPSKNKDKKKNPKQKLKYFSCSGGAIIILEKKLICQQMTEIYYWATLFYLVNIVE